MLRYVLGRLLPAWTALALVLLALLSLIVLLRQQAQALQRTAQQVNATELLRADVLDMETGLRGYALTGDRQFLEPYTRGQAVLYLHIRSLLELAHAAGGETAVTGHARETERLIGAWRQGYVKPLLALNKPGQYALQDVVLSRTGKALVDQVRLHLDAVERFGRQAADRTQARILQINRVWFPLLSALAILALLLNLWVLLRLSGEIRQGVRAVGDEHGPAWLRWRETEEVRASLNTRVGAVQSQLELHREQLRRTGLTLESVLNAMTAQLWLLDAQGRVLRVNRAGMLALELADSGRGRPPLAELWPELAAVLARYPDALPQEPQPLPTPGGPRWYLLTQQTQEGGEAQEEGRMLLLTDVTPLQESRQALEDANLSLSRSNTDLEHYAFVASHDLQEPLRTIASFAGLLLTTQQGRLDERGQFYAGNVIEGAERLKRLIQDLLSFAKVRAEVLEFVPVDMNRVTEEVLGSLRAELERRNASVQVGSLPAVLGRESLLTQLLFNLLQNALKFSREGSSIHVSVSGSGEGTQVHFVVADNGIGIAPEYQEQVFVIFQRLHGRARYEGNGLGLAICRRITELHGGRIWLESREGEGSRFHFTLPAAPLTHPEPAAPLTHPEPAAPLTRPGRLLD